MDLTQLQYFMAVAKLGSMTRAAQELYVAQPTLSQSIARLEESLGIALFDRRQGKLVLNEAGRCFRAYVSQAFAALDGGVLELNEYKEKQANWIKLASSVIDIFRDIILNYYELHPEIRIDHTLCSDQDILELLTSNKVDYVITPKPIADARIDCFPLFTEEVFAVVGGSHPLVSRKTVSLEELEGLPMVCNQCDASPRFLQELFAHRQKELNIITASSEHRVLRHLTEHGACVGFLPARVAVRHLRDGGAQHPLRIHPAFLRTNCISMLRGRRLSPAAEHFYQYIVSFCQADSEQTRRFIADYYGTPIL